MACFADLQLLIGNLFGHLTLERGQRFPFQIIPHRSLPVSLLILKIIWILPFTPLVLTSPLKLISHCPCSPSFLFLVFLSFFFCILKQLHLQKHPLLNSFLLFGATIFAWATTISLLIFWSSLQIHLLSAGSSPSLGCFPRTSRISSQMSWYLIFISHHSSPVQRHKGFYHTQSASKNLCSHLQSFTCCVFKVFFFIPINNHPVTTLVFLFVIFVYDDIVIFLLSIGL